MEDSIFSKIIRGDIPCHKVYEDDHTFAFMDIHPVQPGMVLVVPKQQIDHFFDVPEPEYQSLMQAVKHISQHMYAVLRPTRVGVMIEGLDVAHAHVKLIPIHSSDEFRAVPDTTAPPDQAALAAMAARLAC